MIAHYRCDNVKTHHIHITLNTHHILRSILYKTCTINIIRYNITRVIFTFLLILSANITNELP